MRAAYYHLRLNKASAAPPLWPCTSRTSSKRHDCDDTKWGWYVLFVCTAPGLSRAAGVHISVCRNTGRRAATCPDRDVGPVSADVLSRLLCWGTKGGRRRQRGPLERRSNPYYLSWVPPDWSARPPLNHLWNICSPTFSDVISFYFIFCCGIDEWYSYIGVNAWIRLWVLG